ADPLGTGRVCTRGGLRRGKRFSVALDGDGGTVERFIVVGSVQVDDNLAGAGHGNQLEAFELRAEPLTIRCPDRRIGVVTLMRRDKRRWRREQKGYERQPPRCLRK